MRTATGDVEPERDGGGPTLMSLATDENTGGVIDGIAARFAREDEARMRQLDEEIRSGRREHERKLCPCGCLAPLGECAAGRPRTRSENTQPTPAPKSAQPVAPKETPMPCGNCGKDDHNRRTCPNEKKAPTPAKAPPAKALAPPAPAPAKRGPAVVLEALDVPALLARRAHLRDELQALDAALRARASKLEADRKALLEAVDDAA